MIGWDDQSTKTNKFWIGKESTTMDKASTLASLKATRDILDRFELSAKYALGQNFLVNDDVIKKILSLAQIEPDDLVLEVGPGIGTLTLGLLARGASVVAIERDTDLPQVLAHTTRDYKDHFVLIQGDALTTSWEDVHSALNRLEPHDAPSPLKFVANLPYGVAATVILQYFESMSLDSATVMVQKEVADRIAAVPGTKNYGAYTVKLRLYTQVVDKFLVKPSNFYPQPHVDSTVIRLNRRVLRAPDGSPVSADLLRASAMMADAAFASRRKTLANSCKTFFSGRKYNDKDVASQLAHIFEVVSVDPKRRGETLSLEEFVQLGAALLEACPQ